MHIDNIFPIIIKRKDEKWKWINYSEKFNIFLVVLIKFMKKNKLINLIFDN